jgi:hypothetical protein
MLATYTASFWFTRLSSASRTWQAGLSPRRREGTFGAIATLPLGRSCRVHNTGESPVA